MSTALRTELHTAPRVWPVGPVGPSVDGARHTTLLVLLPPSLASLDDFHSHGFIDAVRQRQLPVDVLLADVTTQHVMEKSVVRVLHTQVLQPALAQGYQSIWLAGISMGAFCALHCAAAHASELAGLCLLAPYPGTADVLAEMRAAGGATPWAKNPAASTTDERAWWLWLARQARQSQHTPWPTPVHLGTGQSDRFIRGQTLMMDLLPQDHVHTLPGGHDWPTWQALWAHWLDHGPLARAA